MSISGTYDPVYGFIPDDDFPEEQRCVIKDIGVYEHLRDMTKDEFIRFCEIIYYKGMMDGYKLEDGGPWIRQKLADYPIEKLEEL